MRKSWLFRLVLLVAFAVCGCSKQPEASMDIPVGPPVLQETQILMPVETVATEPKETVTPETAVAIEVPTGTYSVVDEYVYARTDVNIRSGPGIEYKVLDYLPEGDEINRIGIGSDGWSQVYYKSDGAYIRSKYLTYEKPEAKPAPVVDEKVPRKTDCLELPAGEDFESAEDYKESAPGIVPQTPVETVPAIPQAPVIQPTESPAYVEPERIDTSALTAYGNSFAASLGFSVDYSVRDGYFPPDTIRFSSMSAAYSNVEENVLVLYNNIIARDGSIDGYRYCVTVSDNENGTYTTTVYYG